MSTCSLVWYPYTDEFRWANVTAGNECIVENTPYIAYGVDLEFINIVSRSLISGIVGQESLDYVYPEKAVGRASEDVNPMQT